MSTHRHHIKPRHMGGGNEPENLVDLTVEEHAEAHRILFEEHGHWQDFIAWKALSGQIGKDELRREVVRLANLGRKHSEESKQKIRDARKKQKMTKWSWSEESKNKQRLNKIGLSHSVETKSKMSKALIGRKKPTIKCPHCDKIGGIPQMTQWHFDKCKHKVMKCE